MNDVESVRSVIERYMEGTYRGHVEMLRSCFDGGAAMNGYLQGQLIQGTPEPFFASIGGNPSFASMDVPYSGQIVSVDVTGDAASVILKETGFPGIGGFTDYFHLLRLNGEWKIVSKTFVSEEASEGGLQP